MTAIERVAAEAKRAQHAEKQRQARQRQRRGETCMVEKTIYGMEGEGVKKRQEIRERVQRVSAWHAAGAIEPKPNFGGTP